MARRLVALVLVAQFLTCCSSIPPPATRDRPVRIVVLGDSLSAGFGLPWGAGFPERLEQVLRKKGFLVTIVNAGASGDTVSDGLRRLDRSVPRDTEAVIIELGANDAERRIEPSVTHAALSSILRRLQKRHIQVLLTGFRAPPGHGRAYARAFASIYRSLSSTYSFIWCPEILAGLRGRSGLIQLDGEHPSADGVDVIVARILPDVEQLIAIVRATRRS